MNEIIYSNKIKKSTLKSMNIVIDKDVQIGNNVSLGAGVCLLGNTMVADNVTIVSNSVIENCKIGENVKILSSNLTDSEIGANTQIGPFAHVRANSIIGENCRVGNFVEIKNSIIKNNTKIAHLTYVGDAEIGEFCNLGCGVVFCNYNGKIKQSSKVGDYVFIGSNVNVVAPVKIDNYAFVAAGSTITKDVAENELAIARERQTNKQNFKNPYLENFKNIK